MHFFRSRHCLCADMLTLIGWTSIKVENPCHRHHRMNRVTSRRVCTSLLNVLLMNIGDLVVCNSCLMLSWFFIDGASSCSCLLSSCLGLTCHLVKVTATRKIYLYLYKIIWLYSQDVEVRDTDVYNVHAG